MRRFIQRLVLVFVALLVGYATFAAFGDSDVLASFVTGNFDSLGHRLLISFGMSIAVITGYAWYAAEHADSEQEYINDLTQVYAGVLLLIADATIVVLAQVTTWSITNVFIVFAAAILLLFFLTIDYYDAFLERRLEQWR